MFYDVAEVVWALVVLTIKPLLLTTSTDYDVDFKFYDVTEVLWASGLLRITHSLLITATNTTLIPCFRCCRGSVGVWCADHQAFVTNHS